MGPEACLGSGQAGQGSCGHRGCADLSLPTRGLSPLPTERGHPAMWCGDCLAPGGWGTRPWQGGGAWGRSLPAKAPQPASRCCRPCGWSHVLLVPARLFWDLAWCWRGAGGGVRTHRSSPTPSPGRGSASPLRSSLGLWAGGVRAPKEPPRAQGPARRGDSPSQKRPACLPQGSGSPRSPRPECCAASETLTLHPLEVLLGPGQGTPEVSAE